MPTPTLKPAEVSALEAYRDWLCPARVLDLPVLTGRVSQGSRNTSYELTAATPEGPARFVLRCRRPEQTPLGNSFAQEITALELACAADLAPGLVWHDLSTEVMVMEFACAMDSASVEPLAALAAAIHTLPADLPTMDLLQRLEYYCASAARQGVSADLLIPSDDSGVCKVIDCLANGPQTFCHNDLTSGNVRSMRGGLVAIDWEYAALGSPYFDIAALCADRPALNADAFAAEVFGDALCSRLWQLARHVYAVMNWNWHWASGLTPEPAVDPKQLAAKRDQLLCNLAKVH